MVQDTLWLEPHEEEPVTAHCGQPGHVRRQRCFGWNMDLKGRFGNHEKESCLSLRGEGQTASHLASLYGDNKYAGSRISSLRQWKWQASLLPFRYAAAIQLTLLLRRCWDKHTAMTGTFHRRPLQGSTTTGALRD